MEHTTRDEMMTLAYRELRKLAGNYLRSERTGHTLQPTALVHEAYLRIAEQGDVRWRNRNHFVGVAAVMMRRVLVNYAVHRRREKRGGGEVVYRLEDVENIAGRSDLDLIALDEALERLARDYPQESRIVEVRYFGGLSVDETAELLGVSVSSVERGWRFAKAWLAREIHN